MLQMLANVQKIGNERFLKMIFWGGRPQSFVPAALRPPHLLAPRPRSPSVCARGESVFAPYLPMSKPLLIVCHGTVAHLPRRGGTSAAAAWQMKSFLVSTRMCLSEMAILLMVLMITLLNRTGLRPDCGACRPRTVFLSIFLTATRPPAARSEIWDNAVKP